MKFHLYSYRTIGEPGELVLVLDNTGKQLFSQHITGSADEICEYVQGIQDKLWEYELAEEDNVREEPSAHYLRGQAEIVTVLSEYIEGDPTIECPT